MKNIVYFNLKDKELEEFKNVLEIQDEYFIKKREELFEVFKVTEDKSDSQTVLTYTLDENKYNDLKIKYKI